MHVFDERERMRVGPLAVVLDTLSLSVAPFVTWRRVRLALLSCTLPRVCLPVSISPVTRLRTTGAHLHGPSSSLLRRGSPANLKARANEPGHGDSGHRGQREA
jgi:hypothetical protein